MISKDTFKLISSQGSEAGLSPLDSQAGPTTAPSGQVPPRVNLSRLQASKEQPTTSGISGPLFFGSSPSAALQRSLASRLRQRLEGLGSPLYALTWKVWGMLAGAPVCQLAASGHRTLGNACGGWPTPLANKLTPQTREDFTPNLAAVALLTGWPTPNAGPQNDTDSRWQERREECKEKHSNGNGFGITLGMASQLVDGSISATEPVARLNPDFPRWLMGYPDAWEDCAPTATQLSRK